MCRDQAGNVAASARYAPEGRRRPAPAGGTRRPGCRVTSASSAASRYPAARWEGAAAATPARSLTARFDRRLDRSWRRTSYTGITASTRRRSWAASRRTRDHRRARRRGRFAVSTAGTGCRNAGPHRAVPAALTSSRSCGRCLALGGTPRGAEVGTFVHTVSSSRSTSLPPISPPSVTAASRSRAGAAADRRRLARAALGRAGRRHLHAARAAGRRQTLPRRSPGRPPRRARLRAAPRRWGPPVGRDPHGRHGPTCLPALSRPGSRPRRLRRCALPARRWPATCGAT